MKNKLYLMGGYNKDFNPSLQMFVAPLDTLSNHELNWQLGPNTPWSCSAPIVLYTKFFLTVGGMPTQQGGYTFEVWIFNPSAGQWKQLSDIPVARSFATAVNVANSIMVIGGVVSNNNEYSSSVRIGSMFEQFSLHCNYPRVFYIIINIIMYCSFS